MHLTRIKKSHQPYPLSSCYIKCTNKQLTIQNQHIPCQTRKQRNNINKLDSDGQTGRHTELHSRTVRLHFLMIYLTEVTGGCVNTLRPKIINFQPLYYNYNYKTMFLTEVIDSCVNTQRQEIINCQPLIIKLLLYET